MQGWKTLRKLDAVTLKEYASKAYKTSGWKAFGDSRPWWCDIMPPRYRVREVLGNSEPYSPRPKIFEKYLLQKSPNTFLESSRVVEEQRGHLLLRF